MPYDQPSSTPIITFLYKQHSPNLVVVVQLEAQCIIHTAALCVIQPNRFMLVELLSRSLLGICIGHSHLLPFKSTSAH